MGSSLFSARGQEPELESVECAAWGQRLRAEKPAPLPQRTGPAERREQQDGVSRQPPKTGRCRRQRRVAFISPLRVAPGEPAALLDSRRGVGGVRLSVGALQVARPLAEPGRFGGDTPRGGISAACGRAAHQAGEAGRAICTDFQLRKRSHLEGNRIPQSLPPTFRSYQGGGKAERAPRSIYDIFLRAWFLGASPESSTRKMTGMQSTRDLPASTARAARSAAALPHVCSPPASGSSVRSRRHGSHRVQFCHRTSPGRGRDQEPARRGVGLAKSRSFF